MTMVVHGEDATAQALLLLEQLAMPRQVDTINHWLCLDSRLEAFFFLERWLNDRWASLRLHGAS
jgi:hypothetical protein